MERWAATTLRTLGVVLIAGLVLLTSLFLGLMSLCAYQGGFSGARHPEQGPWYLMGAVLVLVLGVFATARMGRAIIRASAAAAASASAPGAASPAVDQPAILNASQLSPAGRKAVENLVLALGGQILVSAGLWIFSQLHLWSTPSGFSSHNWLLFFLGPFILYHIPYAVLIYALLKKLDRLTITYSLVVPAVLLLQSLFSLTVVGYDYVHHPAGILLLIVPWLMDILVLVLAYKAIQQIGLHPKPSSLIVAAVVMFFYFSAIHVLTSFLYRFARP